MQNWHLENAKNDRCLIRESSNYCLEMHKISAASPHAPIPEHQTLSQRLKTTMEPCQTLQRQLTHTKQKSSEVQVGPIPKYNEQLPIGIARNK